MPSFAMLPYCHVACVFSYCHIAMQHYRGEAREGVAMLPLLPGDLWPILRSLQNLKLYIAILCHVAILPCCLRVAILPHCQIATLPCSTAGKYARESVAMLPLLPGCDPHWDYIPPCLYCCCHVAAFHCKTLNFILPSIAMLPYFWHVAILPNCNFFMLLLLPGCDSHWDYCKA